MCLMYHMPSNSSLLFHQHVQWWCQCLSFESHQIWNSSTLVHLLMSLVLRAHLFVVREGLNLLMCAVAWEWTSNDITPLPQGAVIFLEYLTSLGRFPPSPPDTASRRILLARIQTKPSMEMLHCMYSCSYVYVLSKPSSTPTERIFQ